MIELIIRPERCTKSVAEILAEYAAGARPLGMIIDDFIDTTTALTFEERFAQLTPEMQTEIRRTAVNCFSAFDRIIADYRKIGAYAEGWVAFRDWTRGQPWISEALAQPRPGTISMGELDELQQRFSEQGAALGRLRVERMRAQTDAERDAIAQRIEDLERELAKTNFG